MIHTDEMIKETTRLENFSDGVFAIVITLLALELKIPDDISAENLGEVLLERWPSYISFFISFFSVLIMWVNHHRIFKFIKKADNSFIYLNGLMLCIVSIVPFTTALVSGYFNTSASSLVQAVYAGQFILINISFNWLWYVVRKHKTVVLSAANKKIVSRMTLAYAIGFPGYLLAMGMAFISPMLSMMVCFMLWICWAVAMINVKTKEDIVQ
ncbi:MAG: DUF1211 domain-containing protein [Rhizobacter sp.]|nr:DUF1211 domain-containing protein [Ferruginibacter sp.]